MKRLAVVLTALLAAPSAWSQETRATLQGTVQDPSGDVVPGAPVVATNTGTNVATMAVTNGKGFYVMPYLLPGTYAISVQMSGFKQARRTGVTLAMNSSVRIDVKLELGVMEQVVDVVADAPLLQTTTASGTQTLGEEQVASLPLFGDNSLLLLRAMTGLQWRGQPNYLNLHSNVGSSETSVAGDVGGTEYTLDGVPNLALNRRVAYMPSSETVAEVSVETAAFDASKGHSSGATVSMLTKSGANDVRGSLQWGHWQQRWNATQSTTNLAYWSAIRAAEASGDFATAAALRAQPRQPSGHENSYAATLSGPVRKDKLFFFASFNGYQKSASEEQTAVRRTVPSEAHRRGDFSDLLRLGPQYQIYDPRTARLVNNVVVRDPFPNNQVPILNPLYQHYVKLYPLPNNVPGVVTPDGGNNYLAYGTPWKWGYAAGSARIDWVPSGKHRFFAKSSLNDFVEDRGDWTYETSRFLNSNGLNRHNFAATLDWVYTLNSTTILNASVAYNRFREGNRYKDAVFAFSPTSVGLPAYMDEKAGDSKLLPRVDFSDGVYSDAWDRAFPTDTRYSLATMRVDLRKIRGTHSLKTGVDLRKTYRAGGGGGSLSGRFEFRNSYVRQTDAVSTAANRGLEWAAFMLGVPSTVLIDTSDDYYVTNPYLGFYVHDDWRVSAKLTLNLGVRYELEGGFVERFDRAIGQFDPAAELPVAATMQDSYAALVPTLSPAAAANLPARIEVRGGARYLGREGWPRSLTDAQGDVMPRLGLVYQLRPKTVFRAGYGWFFDTNNVLNEGIDQTGYSRNTSTQITNDRGLTFLNADLANGRTIFTDPFPVRQDGARFNVPLGSQLGVMSRVGGGWDFPGRDWERARQQRWRVGIQQELTRNVIFEVAWLGARSDRISRTDGNPNPLNKRLNPLPEQFWASGNVRNEAIANDLQTAIPNPFALASFEWLRMSNPVLYNDMATRGLFTNTTIRKNQLLRQWPHMGSVQDTRAAAGEDKYDHVEAALTKRFASGSSLVIAYTRAWNQVRNWYANEFDEKPRWRVSAESAPHHLMLNAVVDAPFGKGKRFFKDGILAALLGGWRVAPVYHLQSGRTFDFGNRFWYGETPKDPLDPNDAVYRVLKLDHPTRERWFNIEPFLLPSARAQYPDWATNRDSLARVVAATNAARPADFHRRVFPSRFDFLRGDRMNQLDVSLTRRVSLGGHKAVELRADVVNAFNSVIWDQPNTDPYNAAIGSISGQWGTPRWITLKARLSF